MINGDQEPILSTSQDVALDIFGPIAFTTSTPSISTPTTRQSGRKSWFDNNLGNPGKGTKYEIAIEKRAKRRSRRLSEEEEMETLTLTHFTNPPRIGFGKATTGSVKKRNLLIKNPHEYPQDVKVEKFPFKKHFDIDQTRFTVEAEGTLQLTITWLPEEEGNFREMILFQVDGAYRLQAFVFGCVEKPPQKRKMKKGLLGKTTQKPFAVIQTPSLANIAKSYSPTKGEKKRRSGEGLENKAPVPVKKARTSKFVHLKEKQPVVPPNRVLDDNDSLIPIGHITPIKPFENSVNTPKCAEFVVPKVVKLPGKSTVHKVKDENQEGLESLSPLVAKYLDHSDDDIIVVPQSIRNGVGDTTDINTQDKILLTNLNTPDRILLTNPKFHSPGNFSARKENASEVSDDVKSANHNTPDTGDIRHVETRVDFLSPNSFLHDSHREADASFFSPVSAVARQPAHSTILPTPERMAQTKQFAKGFISPNKFLKELNESQEQLELSLHQDPNTIPSPESILNSSIPHAIMVKQLKNVKTSLVTQAPRPLFSPMSMENKRETYICPSAAFSTQSPGFRRETFVRTKKLIPPNEVPMLASPRRTTFTLQGKTKALKKDNKSEGGKPVVTLNKCRNGTKDSSILEQPSVGRTTQDRMSQDSLDGTVPGSPFPVQISGRTLVSAISTPELNEGKPTITLNKCKNGTKDNSIWKQPSVGKTKQDRMSQDSLDGTVPAGSPFPVQTSGHTLVSAISTPELTSVNSATVTKGKSVGMTTPEGRVSAGKMLFTPDLCAASPVDEHDDSVFRSPVDLPVDTPMRELCTRRATLTVTKEKPSSALMQATQNPVSNLLDNDEIAIPEEVMSPNTVHDKIKASPTQLMTVVEENPERCFSVLLKNNNSPDTGRHSVGRTPTEGNNSANRTGSFNITPHQLPTSPNPDNSRRSTHIVENPKVLDLSVLGRKRLFPPLEGFDTNVVDPTNTSDQIITTVLDSPTKVKDPVQGSVVVNTQVQEEKPKIARDTFQEKSVVVEYKPVGSSIVKTETSDENNVQESTPEILVPPECVGSSGLITENVDTKNVPESPQVVPVSSESPTTDKISTEGTKPYVTFLSCSPITGQSQQSATMARAKAPVTREVVKKRAHSENRKPVEVASKKLRSAGSYLSVKSEMVKAGRPASSSRPLTNPRVAAVAKAKTGRVKPPGVAQTKLILMKKSRPTALPKHPMPFASKNMYYDERWVDKQERGFVHWLNFVLTPADEYQHSNKRVKVDAGTLCLEATRSVKLAPTKEVLSIRAYSARRRLNQLRRSACNLFQKKEIVRVVQKLEAEIESLRLVIRKDKKVHADLGMKQNILDMILSFNPLWLRIGLETVYGEMIPMQNNGDIIGISRFIVTRLLSNPDIAAEYCHPTVPHLYRDGYADAIAQYLLKKLFMLIFFLDQAKSRRLIHHDPCLFCKDADFKSTKAMLIQFSRDYLSGEGDVTKHLGYLGYVVTHQQTSMDEFDYAVTNLAVDLRDGVRLTRILELLTNRWELSKSLRAPAISRLQKVHNIDVVFKALMSQGVTFDKKITTKDIVDGHREKTLQILWALVLQYQVNVLLDEEQLKEEISILQRSLRVKNQLEALHRFEQGLSEKRRESAEPDLHLQSARLSLLLRWCRTVCAFYHIKIENFTVSFGDGQALCALVHHYHPSLLPWGAVNTKTTLTYQDDLEKERCALDLNSSEVFSPAPFPVAEDPALFEQFLSNEKANFKLLYEKVSELGGIPLMLRSVDMSNTIPDEKVVVTYICYLCARLLDIRHEARAARVIQLAWRRHYLRRSRKELQVKHAAAVVLQKAARKMLEARRAQRQAVAARTIQTCVRYWLAHRTVARLRAAHRDRRRQQAAAVIQRYTVGYLARCHYLQKRQAAVSIQSHVRGFLQRCRKQKRNTAATVIQAWYRGTLVTRKEVARYRQLRKAVVVVQRTVRQWLQRRLSAREGATVKIQAAWRGHRQKEDFKHMKSACLVLQTQMRMYNSRQRYRRLRQAAICIQQTYRDYHTRKVRWGAAMKVQAAFRGHKARQTIKHLHSSAVMIQKHYKGWQVHRRYQVMRSAVVTLQRWRRGITLGRLARSQYTKVRASVVKIQSAFRGHRARSEFVTMKSASITIQSWVKGHIQRKNFLRMKSAALVVQRRFTANIQGRRIRKEFLVQKGAAMTMQACFRGRKVRQEIAEAQSAATKIQAVFRGHLQRKMFLGLKNATIVTQLRFRAKMEGRKVRQEFLVRKGAAITIQAAFRGHKARQTIKHLHSSAVMIQKHYKGWQVHRRYQAMRSAVVTLQRWRRGITLGRLARSQYTKVRTSVVKIQSAFRGHRARSEFVTLKSASITIQSWVKGHIQRKMFLRMKSAALVVQRRFTAKIEGRRIRKEFLVQKGAAMTIQACFRGHKVRQAVAEAQSAAIKIQAGIKSHLQRRMFLRLKSATLVTQQRFRAKMEGRKVRQEFLVRKGAAITIQAAFRGHKVRQTIKHLHSSAVMIQKHYKGWQVHSRYQVMRSAVVTLQRWRRGITLGRLARSQYTKVKASVVKIQSAFRGHRARSEFVTMKSASITIQSWVKGHQQRTSYRKVQGAAVTMQRRFRAKRDGDMVRRHFLIQKGAIITIQSAYRGYKVRQEFKMLHSAATKIEAMVKGRIQRKRFLRMKSAAIVMQRRFTANIQGRRIRKEFLVQKGAAMMIQACFRGHRVRQEIAEAHSAATKIQAVIRSHLQRKAFLELKNATIVTQQRFRAKMEGRNVRKEFLVRKGAAITIQAAFRGHKVRQTIKHLHSSAVMIQKHYKGWQVHRRYQVMRSAVVTLQRWRRGITLGRLARSQYTKVRTSVVKIQSAFRGHKARSEFVNLISASITIQSWVKGHIQRNNFLRIKSAALVVQRRFTAMIEGRRIRKEFLVQKGAAMTIQACFRGHKVRQEIAEVHSAATKIQAVIRGHLHRKTFLRLKNATIVTQLRFRAKMEGRKVRNDLLVMKGAAMTIQAAFRSFTVRKMIARWHQSATVIQCVYRMYRATHQYRAQRTAALCVQRWYRNSLFTRQIRANYCSMRDAAIIIQSCYRCHRAVQTFQTDKSNVIKSQAIVRGYLERRRFLRLRKAAVVIQQRFVAERLCVNVRKAFLIQKGAAMTIQAAFRGHKVREGVRRQHAAAVILQTVYRTHCAVEVYRGQRRAVVTIQRWYRSWLYTRSVRKDYLSRRSAAMVIQKYVRAHLSREAYLRDLANVILLQALVRRMLQRTAYRRLQWAAVVCQVRYRATRLCHIQRCYYQSLVSAAIVLQSAWRRRKVQTEYHSVKCAAIFLQSRVRMVQERKKFCERKAVVIQCQRRVRSKLVMQECRRNYLAKLAAISTIQAHIRSFLVRKQYHKTRQAVICVQACVRRFLAQRQYRKCMRCRLAVTCLQRVFRIYLFRRRLQQWMQKRNKAATVIQSCYRGYEARRYVRNVHAAIVIQSVYRMYVQKRRYQKAIQCVVQIQSLVRGGQARRRVRHIRARHSAATCIQAAYRAFKERRAEEELMRRRSACLERFCEMVATHLSVIKIQRCYRNHRVLLAAKQRLQSIVLIQRGMKAKLTRLRYLRFVCSVRLVQTQARRYLQHRNASVIRLQAVVRGWLGRRWIIRRERAALHVQSIWRGRKVRKNYHSKKFENLRKNLKEATQTATEEKKLGNRTESALDYLLKYKQLSHILEALVHLETSTRLSPACCQRMVDVNAVGVMYVLIQSCNRSQPHMEIIKYSINILLNLAKYEKTRSAVYDVEGATESLLELMQVYRDKGFIFSCACTLMGIMGMMENRRKAIVADKQTRDKLQSIFSLTARKHKITETRLIRQAKLTAAKSFNSTLPIIGTQRKQHRIHPEWVLQRNKMRQIEDPLQAIKFVLDNFHLLPK